MKSKILVGLVAVAICLPALWPLTNKEFFHLHDWTHVARLVEMHQALVDGHFPVRWSRNLGYGYGLPQFNFYAPLAYYIAEVFNLFGFTPLNSIKWLIGINFIGSFLAMYALVSERWKGWAGMVAATAFIYIPYRAVDTYVRGALGELTAITLLTISLYLLLHWVRAPSKRGVGLTALAIGGMVTAHNLVAFISLPVLLMVGLVMLGVKKSFNRLPPLLGIFALGLGVSAFYILPAVGEKNWTSVNTLTVGFSDYHQHFLYLRQFFVEKWGYGGSIFGLEDNISFAIGWIQVGLAIMGILTMVKFHTRRYRSSTALILISATIILYCMLMSSFKSEWLWDRFSDWFKYVQFPWRYLSIIIVFIAILDGASSRWVIGQKRLVGVIYGLLVMGLLIGFNLKYFRPEEYLTDTESLYFEDAARIQSRMSQIIPDFTPAFGSNLPTTPPLERFEVTPKPNEITIDNDLTAQFHLTITSQQASSVAANILYFPGWHWFVNGHLTPVSIDPVKGTMAVQVPPGQGITVSGKFEETPLRTLSDLISLITLIVIIYLILPAKSQLERIYGRH